MEFWGVELKGDKPVKIAPGMNHVVHLSQATLAELKKGSDPVMLYAKVGNQKLVIGVLRADNLPQLTFDLVFEKEFELSHNWKNGSVHLTGYKSLIPDEDEEEFSDFSDDDEAIPIEDKQSGVAAAPAATKAKPAAPAAKKDNKPKEESDESDDSESDDEDDESDEEMADSDEDDSEEDESDEEETPAKSTGGKKRPAAAATKTPEAKKVKVVTPQKTDGKKSVGGHIATPYPAKNAKTPKSGGQVACGSCKKTFNSPNALDSHTKAKHTGK